MAENARRTLKNELLRVGRDICTAQEAADALLQMCRHCWYGAETDGTMSLVATNASTRVPA